MAAVVWTGRYFIDQQQIVNDKKLNRQHTDETELLGNLGSQIGGLLGQSDRDACRNYRGIKNTVFVLVFCYWITDGYPLAAAG